MTSVFVFLLIAILLLFFSLRERVRLYHLREKDWSIIGDAKSSPVSRALANLVGMAGGIYLSLIVLTTFVELKLPEEITLLGIPMEPLASISIFLALVQPIVQRFVFSWKRV